MSRRIASGIVDGAIELGGGLLGSYFGALVAALLVAMKDGPAEQMQSSIWNGFGFGFVFWTLSISFINRVLIQGLSRSSIGKKVFKIELISTRGPLTWTMVMKRWVLSFASFAACGAGYIFAFFNREGRAFHDLVAHTDLIPLYEGRSMSIEHREEAVVSISQMRQMLVLSQTQAERPTATIIKLPVRESSLATGTDSVGATAKVISINQKLENDDNEVKKVA